MRCIVELYKHASILKNMRDKFAIAQGNRHAQTCDISHVPDVGYQAIMNSIRPIIIIVACTIP